MESEKVYTVKDSDSEEDIDEDEANLPSREECEERCQTFAEVTGTDSALAMFYLQDREWDVQRSISDYFADQDKEAPSLPLTSQVKQQKKLGEKKRASMSDAIASHKVNTVDSESLTLG
ncbi:TRAF and TNF receptor-associated protein [Elysia marginata]|uniref:TRAF and TNF receptor-associated protein n=1 Tax=Elysia marginata TaxID=1093978 RepID=A0AAV4F9T6_9GAST|nr:TRAF and TNF receptor-associated protein [Elysia marginata]